MRHRSIAVLVLGAVFTLMAPDVASQTTTAWKAPARAAGKQSPIPANASSVAAGKKVYVENCESCHGPKGRGDGLLAKDLDRRPGNLANETMWDQTDGELFWKITQGNRPMPAFGDFMAEEPRWQVVSYIRTLAKKKETK